MKPRLVRRLPLVQPVRGKLDRLLQSSVHRRDRRTRPNPHSLRLPGW
jgi:hypothetical protein